jgi:hypothetical protein
MSSDSPKALHGSFAQPLRRSAVTALMAHPAFQRLRSAVSSGYDDFDTSRQMLEGSLELSFRDLEAPCPRLRAQARM